MDPAWKLHLVMKDILSGKEKDSMQLKVSISKAALEHFQASTASAEDSSESQVSFYHQLAS